MGRKKEKKENYLDYVFMKNPAYAWKEKEDGLVRLSAHSGRCKKDRVQI